jgi:hypothetical protein
VAVFTGYDVRHKLDAQPFVVSVMLWAVVFPLLQLVYRTVLDLCCAHVPYTEARIPRVLPAPDPPGETPDFPIAVPEATGAELAAFMKFRGASDEVFRGCGASQGPTARKADCYYYKGEMSDLKHSTWDREHFEERKRGLLFPVCPPHWNGWRGWWAETGPARQKLVVGHLAFATEHLVCGLLLPMNYLYGAQWGLPYGGQVVNYVFAMYGDIGGNVVDAVGTAASYLAGRNLSLLQLSRPIWPLVLAHHVAAIGMCSIGLWLEGECPYDLACLFILSLLGTTGLLHLLSGAPLSSGRGREEGGRVWRAAPPCPAAMLPPVSPV